MNLAGFAKILLPRERSTNPTKVGFMGEDESFGKLHKRSNRSKRARPLAPEIRHNSIDRFEGGASLESFEDKSQKISSRGLALAGEGCR
jgi:hypothetical protein